MALLPAQLLRHIEHLERSRVQHSIQQGMLVSLPVLVPASFAALITNFPVASFRFWLKGFLGGAVFNTLTLLQSATSSIIALIFLLSISFCFERVKQPRVPGLYPITALCSYIAFFTDTQHGFSFDHFNSQWIFYAIVIAALSSAMLETLLLVQKKRQKKYRGESSLFFALLPSLFPIGITVLFFTACNLLFSALFHHVNVQVLLSSALVSLFDTLGRTLPSGLLVIFLLHTFWFLGIEGNTTLDLISGQLLIPGTEIISGAFWETFVLLGGCGSALCLVIAILLFDSRRSKRSLAKIAFFPVLFNINELILFGIPIILNPLYLIPFLLTPLVLTLSSYASVLLGLVPHAVSSVAWTTPLFVSGYLATGSLAGTVLQLVNLALGVIIYLPFVYLSQYHQKINTKQQVEKLVHFVQEGEAVGKVPRLLDPDSPLYSMANILADDLAYAMQTNALQLYYQPQVDEAGRLAGAEALLRWEYFSGSFLYPPLIIALAEEKGLQQRLGDYIMQTIGAEMQLWREVHGLEIPISFNVTASMLEKSDLPERLMALRQQHGISPGLLGVEITEQTALSLSADVQACLDALRNAGAKILLDDFGMGHSSMMYLQNNHFDVVKLDASLIRQLLSNPRSKDIIGSIIYLSRSLLFDVCAEFVETEEQAETLRKLGCQKFQGYLYSPPLEKERFLSFATSLNQAHQIIQQRFAAKSN